MSDEDVDLLLNRVEEAKTAGNSLGALALRIEKLDETHTVAKELGKLLRAKDKIDLQRSGSCRRRRAILKTSGKKRAGGDIVRNQKALRLVMQELAAQVAGVNKLLDAIEVFAAVGRLPKQRRTRLMRDLVRRSSYATALQNIKAEDCD